MKTIIFAFIIMTSFMSFAQNRCNDQVGMREFRCQLTTKNCGHNGGRFGVLVQAQSQCEAKSLCLDTAHKGGYGFCQVSATQQSSCQSNHNSCGDNRTVNQCPRTTNNSNCGSCQACTTGRSSVTKRFRCQLTKKFCGHNGGRYGYYITASSYCDAIVACKDKAYNSGHIYCQVLD